MIYVTKVRKVGTFDIVLLIKKVTYLTGALIISMCLRRTICVGRGLTAYYVLFER